MEQTTITRPENPLTELRSQHKAGTITAIEPAPIVTLDPTTDDFLKVLWTASKEQKRQAFQVLKGEGQAPSPVVVKRIQFEKMYNSKEVREITGLHRNTIGKATRSGELRAIRRKPHTPYLYPESAVRDWLEAYKSKAAAGTSENQNTKGDQQDDK